MDNNLFQIEDLVDNPVPRIPICLCLDVSGSMDGEPINELNKGIATFFEAIEEDDTAKSSAEICIVTFSNTVNVVRDFSGLSVDSTPPTLEADGMTYLGEGIVKSLELLEERKKQYKENGVDYYQPWLVIMTDGIPNGDKNILQTAIDSTVELISSRKLTIFPIPIGKEADMKVLNDISPNRKPLKLQGLKFREFFTWLSKSVSKVSQSTPGDTVPLDVDGIKGWGEL